ncbi:MAG: metallophosphoesterase family protein [Candidatus Thorarchaeota archaeon]|jgi:predicted phosphodiesterase
MLIHFVGDTHGYYEYLARISERTEAEIVVQVGDLGILPKVGYNISPNLQFAKPTYFIDGNHDDINYIEHKCFARGESLARGLYYLRRGGAEIWGGKRFSFLGGANSIDKHLRTEGVDWFREEIPSQSQISSFAASTPDIVVTHTAPALVAHRFFGYKSDCPLANDLDKVLKLFPDFRPKVWIFGHHHKDLMVEVKDYNIMFCGLNCFGMKGDQLILNTDDLSVEWLNL